MEDELVRIQRETKALLLLVDTDRDLASFANEVQIAVDAARDDSVKKLDEKLTVLYQKCFNSIQQGRGQSHKWLWYGFLIPLLFGNVVGGLLIIYCSKPESFALLFAVGGFSIAYSLHILSASGALCSAQIQRNEKEKAQFYCLRNLEYKIVTFGMCVLGGGLLMVFAGLLCAFKHVCFGGIVFGIGGLLELIGVVSYVRTRRWADKARQILWGVIVQENPTDTCWKWFINGFLK